MNTYELFVLFGSALGEEKTEGLLSKVEKKIQDLGGEIQKIDKWGNRRLASEIKKAKKAKHAYYVLIYFKSESSLPDELLKYLKFTENILRYSLIRAQEKAMAQIEGTPVEEKEEKSEAQKKEESDIFAIGAQESGKP